MPLWFHLSIHAALAILSGWMVGRAFGRPLLGILAGFLSGFLIDLDHVIEYFFTFGLSFNLRYFFEARHFLISDQARIIFHAWEYILPLAAGLVIFRRYQKVAACLAAFLLAMVVHLASDCLINHYPPQYYSLAYRRQVNYQLSSLLSPEQYQKNQELKAKLGI